MAQDQTSKDGVLSDVAKKAFEQKATKKKPRASQSSSGGGTRFDLDESQTVASGSAAITAWTVFDCSDHVPSDAKYAVLQCFGRNVSSPTGARDFSCRREDGAIERRVVTTRGTTTSDISVTVCEAHIELTDPKTFEYKTSAMTEYEVLLIGYTT